jgi:hypothetical protein
VVKKKTSLKSDSAPLTERDVLRAIAQAVDDIRDHVPADEETQRFILSSIPDDEFFEAVAERYPGALTLAFMEVRMTELAKRAGNPVLAGVIARRFKRLRANGNYEDVAWRKIIGGVFIDAGDLERGLPLDPDALDKQALEDE